VLLVFLLGLFASILSAWMFYKIGFYSIALFIIFGAFPFINSNLAGFLSIFAIPLAMGTAGGICFKKGLDFAFYLKVSLLIFTVLFTSGYHSLRIFKGVDILEKSRDDIVVIMEQNSKELDKFFLEYKTPEEDQKRIKEDIRQSIDVLKDSKWLQLARDMIPFSIFFYGIVLCGFSFLILKKLILKAAGLQVRNIEFFKLNDYIIFILIAGWGAFILLDSSIYPLLSITVLNIALIVSTLYIIQAIGVIKHFLISKGIPVIIIPLAFITLALLGTGVIVFTTTLLLGLGTLDLWADFRKLNS